MSEAITLAGEEDDGEGRPREVAQLKAARLPIDEGFDVALADSLAKREAYNKHLYRPNTYLHKWWARRCGSTFRLILKRLVDEPARRDYYAPGGLEGKLVLDPMMGGGTTLHEAIRLGASVVGVDLDPIPVLQARASLRRVPLAERRAAFEPFLAGLRAALAPLYQTACPTCRGAAEVQFTLYGLRRRCDCREALLVDDLTLRDAAGGAGIRLCATCGEAHPEASGHRHAEAAAGLVGAGLVVKGCPTCDSCGAPFRDLLDEPYARRYRPLVVVGHCPEHGRCFGSLGALDRETLRQATAAAADLDFGERAAFAVPAGPKSDDLRRRNVASFLDLFAPRQLLYLHAATRLLGGYSPAERLWLALLVSTSLEFNSLLCGYKGADRRRPGAIRHVFSHHAYSFPYTALENNPVFSGPASGTLERLFRDRVVRAGEWAAAPTERRLIGERAIAAAVPGEVDGGEEAGSAEALRAGGRRFWALQRDARRLPLPDGVVDCVVTDPPYYDSVQYGDLSAYFRVWLRRFLPDAADWGYDQAAAAVAGAAPRESGGQPGHGYGDALGGIWRECARVLEPRRGRLVFTFHHWRPEAWAELTISLRRAGFSLVNRYVVASESPSSVHIRQLRALRHDAILVLAPPGAPGAAPRWPRPDRVEPCDSRSFCADCGSALGWLLGADLDEAGVRAEWRRLLSGAAGGDPSTSRPR